MLVSETDGKKVYPELPEADIKKRFDNPMVTLIETPSDQKMPISTLLGQCNYCTRGKVDSCSFSRSTFCGYYKTLVFVYPTSCVPTPSTTSRPLAPKRSDSKDKVKVGKSQQRILKVTSEADQSKESPSVSSTIQATPTHIVPTATEAESIASEVQTSDIDASQIKPSATSDVVMNASGSATPQLTPDVSSQDVTTTPDGTVTPSTSVCESDSTTGDCAMKPDVIQIRPTR